MPIDIDELSRFLGLSDHDRIWANAIRESGILTASRQHCSDAVMYDLLEIGLHDDKKYLVAGKESSKSGEGSKLLPPINQHIRRYTAVMGARLWRHQEEQREQVLRSFSSELLEDNNEYSF